MIKQIFFSILVSLSVQVAHAQGDLYIGSGATLYTNGSSTITLQNTKLTNNGSLTANDGTVAFKGNGTNAQSSMNGTGTTAFKNVTIDKTANGVQLNQNISVSGNFTLTSGELDLAAGNVDFGTTGSLQSETATNRVSGTGGYLQTTPTLNAPTSVNPANLGAMITSTQNLGSTQIRRLHTIATVSGNSIARRYALTPTNNSDLNATLRFHYFDAELNSNNENSMMLWRSADNGATWILQSNNTRDVVANWIQQSGIAAFSDWTAATSSVISVELLSFLGKHTEGGNLLTWETASEVNNKGFDIERAPHPPQGASPTWETIGFINAKGKAASYTFTDDYRLSPVAYYRLKQVDNDGKFAYSKIISIVQSSKGKGLSLYPNPVSSHLTIENTDLSSGTHKGGTFQILNLLGQQVLTGKTPSGGRGLDVSALPQGTYVLKIGAEQVKFIKQ